MTATISLVEKLRTALRDLAGSYPVDKHRETLQVVEEKISASQAQASDFEQYGKLDKRQARFLELRETGEFLIDYSQTKDSDNLDPQIEEEISEIITFILEERLNREHDSNNAVIIMQASSPGESGNMTALFEAYKRFGEGREYEIVELDADARSIIFQVKGEYAYGLFRVEQGNHRFVSFKSRSMKAGEKNRQDISITVKPEIEKAEFEIKNQDLRYEFLAAGTNGGQNANKTHTGVRVTHKNQPD